MSKCPISSADSRLRDSFYYWRKLENNYFHTESFRINLNSFVQEARNVTFILQAQKGKLAGFEDWYSPWQKTLKEDPVLRWIVESRNRITKVGDLETSSTSVVEFITDWTGQLGQRFTANPLVPTSDLIRLALAKIPKEHIFEESLLCIERRWTDSLLPDAELLAVTSHALQVLSKLMSDAHDTLIAKTHPGLACECHKLNTEKRHSYPLELADAHESRKVWIKLSDSTEIKYQLTDGGTFDRTTLNDWAKRAKERYDLPETRERSRPEGSKLATIVERFEQSARRMLEVDKYLTPFIFAAPLNEGALFTLQLRIEDRVGKHLAIRRAAGLLENLEADWVLLIGEVWTAIPETHAPNSYRHAEHSPTRGEAISVEIVSADGTGFWKIVPFTREPSGIQFGQIMEGHEVTNIMSPILAAIRR